MNLIYLIIIQSLERRPVGYSKRNTLFSHRNRVALKNIKEMNIFNQFFIEIFNDFQNIIRFNIRIYNQCDIS